MTVKPTCWLINTGEGCLSWFNAREIIIFVIIIHSIQSIHFFKLNNENTYHIISDNVVRNVFIQNCPPSPNKLTQSIYNPGNRVKKHTFHSDVIPITYLADFVKPVVLRLQTFFIQLLDTRQCTWRGPLAYCRSAMAPPQRVAFAYHRPPH